MSDVATAAPEGCQTFREHLSDLLDVRRGELPPPSASPLADAAFRARVEAHVHACAECRAELQNLEELGLAYADFGVGARSAQEFSGFAAAVRKRIAGQPAAPAWETAPAPRRVVLGWPSWVGLTLSSAAAAMLAVLAAGAFAKPSKRRAPSAENTAAQAPKPAPVIANNNTPMPFYKSLTPSSVDLLPAFSYGDRNGLKPVQPGKLEEIERQLKPVLEREGTGCFLEDPPKGVNRWMGAMLAITRGDQANPAGHPNGLYIHKIEQNSPAHQAGLLPGQYLLRLNGLSFEKSTFSEAMKYLNALNQIEKGEWFQIDYAEPTGNDWVLRRTHAKAGEYAE